MSVVGFDLGYQSCHVAIVRYGGVEVIANEYSDRKSLSLVAFGEKQRLMGHSAKNQQIQNFKKTIYGFRELLGRRFSDPYVQQEMKTLPFTLVGKKNGSIGIKVKNGNEEKIYSPEQITAMMFTYLKKIAEKDLGKPVADCVISVPSYFNDAQRRALLDASTIAGLNCLRLFNDTTAAALAYGIYKQDLPAETEKPRNVVFVDMGHSALQVAICSFQKGKLNVLAKTFDPTIGGRNFDLALAEYFAKEFEKKYKIGVMGQPKRFLRLMAEVEKVKKTMSTVTTPVPLNIECFADDRDVSGTINREVFNELCGGLLSRVRCTLEASLAKSKLSLKDIYAVEVIGGSCRVPAVKDIIVDVYKHDLSTTLNLDEAVCRGCGLQCAMLSPTFKVRDFSVTDIQPYPIQLKWQAPMEGEDGEMVVFKEGDAIYHSKMLTFHRKEDFDLEASYQRPEELPCSGNKLGKFTIKNVVPTQEGEASKVKVKVRVNIHGIFYIKSAMLVEKTQNDEAMETDSVPNEVQLPDVEMMSGGKSGTDEKKPEEGVGSNTGQEGENVEGTNETEETNAGSSKNDSPDIEKKMESAATAKPTESKSKKPTVKYIDLPIVDITPSMTKKELDGAHEIEVNLNYQDQLEQQKADARNAVEEYVYNMREKLYELGEFITEDDKSAFGDLLTTTEDWLYDEGEDQPKKVYVEKLTELKKSGDPVIAREREFNERPKAFNELGSAIVHYEKILQNYEQGVELYNHLDQAEMDKVKEQVETKRAWHETQMQACQAIPKHLTAPVTSAQIRAEAQNLHSTCKPIVSKPKPKVEPPKDDQPAEEATTAGDEVKMEEQSNETDDHPAAADDMDLD